MYKLILLFKKLPDIVKYLFYIIGLILAYILIKPIVSFVQNICRRFKAAADQRKYNQNRETVREPDGSERTVNTMVNAQNIFDAFFDNDWIGGSEDETKAIAALLATPKHLISQLARNYHDIKQQNLGFTQGRYKTTTLQADVRKFLDDTQYKQVEHLFI